MASSNHGQEIQDLHWASSHTHARCDCCGHGRERQLRRRRAFRKMLPATLASVAAAAVASQRGSRAAPAALAQPTASAQHATAPPMLAVDKPLDYLLSIDWVQSVHPRVCELAPPPADENSRLQRRLLMPRRLQDLWLLRQLKEESLRVELLAHRIPSPHVHVQVYTNGVALYPPPPRKRWLPARWLPPRRSWLSMFQAVAHFPQGIALLSCDYAWRWAAFNFTEQPEAFNESFRVLEISCPRRLQGFLALPVRSPGDRPRTWRRRFVHCFQVAFLLMLVVGCLAQIVLLLVCITMLLVQARRARQGFA